LIKRKLNKRKNSRYDAVRLGFERTSSWVRFCVFFENKPPTEAYNIYTSIRKLYDLS